MGPTIKLELRSIPIASKVLRRQTQTSGPRLRGFLCIDPTLSDVRLKEVFSLRSARMAATVYTQPTNISREF
jgi:hypothetical protein